MKALRKKGDTQRYGKIKALLKLEVFNLLRLERFPSRKRWFLRSAFYWFLDFMITNWGYFLLNNMEYWKPSLVASCEAIRLKLMNLN